MIELSNKLEKMFEEIVKKEGGYVNHPNDRAGPTKFGVTQKTLSKYLGRKATIADVRSLSKDTAIDIYFRDYYYLPKIHTLPKELQLFVTDMSVNHGPANAIFILQDVLATCGMIPKSAIDKILGPKTAKATADLYAKIGDDLINKLVLRRKEFYRSIVRNDPTQQVFLNGWLARADSFLVA
jgi:lysozyme family protein